MMYKPREFLKWERTPPLSKRKLGHIKLVLFGYELRKPVRSLSTSWRAKSRERWSRETHRSEAAAPAPSAEEPLPNGLRTRFAAGRRPHRSRGLSRSPRH